eukprot:2499347-Amphidinium_carterae.1
MTLAQAGDAIIRGNLARALATICSRFAAVETAHLDGSWNVATQLEVLPDQKVSAVPGPLRRAAAAQDKQNVKYGQAGAKGPTCPAAFSTVSANEERARQSEDERSYPKERQRNPHRHGEDERPETKERQ